MPLCCRRVAKELRDSGVDRFIQPGFGRPPFQTAVDDPYETYEANILWDQEERSEGSFGGSHSQDGLLADSAVKTQTRPTSVSEGETIVAACSAVPLNELRYTQPHIKEHALCVVELTACLSEVL